MSPTDTNNTSKPSILKNTREARGLTLEIVHEATKIPMDALRAIEEGYTVRILSPFYYKGFIKIYSEFLGLDVAEMYRQYGLDKPASTGFSTAADTTPIVPKSKPKAVKQQAGPNVFLEKLQEASAAIFTPQNLKLIGKIAVYVIGIILLVRMAGCIASHWHKKAPAPKRHAAVQAVAYQEQQTEQPAQETAEQPTSQPAYVPPASSHKAIEAPSQDNKVEVAVRASKDLWLRVKTDNKVVFETTLSKGSMETWTANDKIELSGRDLELLDMEVNYKQIGFLGGGERRIRRVWITSQGLTVKK